MAAENGRLRAALEAERAEKEALRAENERLRGDLAARGAEQAATTTVLRTLASPSADLRRVLDTLAELAAKLCDADDAVIGRVEGETAGPVAHFGTRPYPADRPLGWDRPLVGSSVGRSVVGEAIRRRGTVSVADLQATPEEEMPAPGARRLGVRAIAATPLLADETVVGYITLQRFEPRAFSEHEMRQLETFAAQAAIALQNARLLAELSERNATLKEALERQTATSDIMGAIAASPADLEAVLTVILDSANRLCEAGAASVWRLVGGDLVHDIARTSEAYGFRTARFGGARRAADASWGPGVVVTTGRTLHLPDLAAIAAGEGEDARVDEGVGAGEVTSAGWTEWVRNLRENGDSTWLGAPLLREGRAVGALVVARMLGARPFSEQHVALLESFARQAAIALENNRLFTELRERDERRRQELERAAKIQQRLLPSFVEGWPGMLEVAVRFRPAVETSGDFYDVLALPPVDDGLGPLQIAVGDVAGKGMSAALVTALARSALRSTASVPTRMAVPSATLREAGGRLHRDVGAQHFVACALGVVEPPGLHNAGPLLRLANAAQVPVLLVREGVARDVEPPGYRLPLGAQADGAYEDARAELRAGDVVVFSSDGLVEAPALGIPAVPSHLGPAKRSGELFGFGRLGASAAHWAGVGESAEEVAAGIWGDLTAWCGEESHDDDVTLLVLRVAE